MNKKNNKPIYVTKPFLPPISEYIEILNEIWSRKYLTNQGPVVLELQEKLKSYLGVTKLAYVTNGTIALQIALSALDINEGEVITTPFTYVATISSVLWQRCTPIFVDIDEKYLTIDANKIEEKITTRTKAIMAVHVFGIPCDVEKINSIAKKHDLKVIYDAAHAFGVKYKGKGLCNYGDVTTLSFHSTKLFHTVEGGAIVVRDSDLLKKIDLQIRFGHNGDDYYMLGINGKNSELHAAMGLVVLRYIDNIIADRKKICNYYTKHLNSYIKRPEIPKDCEYNYAYYPIILKDEKTLIEILDKLKEENIFPRRYFYPSLNTLPYVTYNNCQVSEDITSRILCLPLFLDLDKEDQDKIIMIINTYNHE